MNASICVYLLFILVEFLLILVLHWIDTSVDCHQSWVHYLKLPNFTDSSVILYYIRALLNITWSCYLIEAWVFDNFSLIAENILDSVNAEIMLKLILTGTYVVLLLLPRCSREWRSLQISNCLESIIIELGCVKSVLLLLLLLIVVILHI